MDLRIFDSPEFCDRYTVLWPNGSYLGMSENPQGFCQHGEGASPGKHLGKEITINELPKDCQKVIAKEV